MSKTLQCYAKNFGGCCSVQSKEHYYTRGLFEEKMLTVDGHSWLDGQTKKISANTLGVRILCETHNKSLSPLDHSAIKIWRTTGEMFVEQNLRAQLPRKLYMEDHERDNQWQSLRTVDDEVRNRLDV